MKKPIILNITKKFDSRKVLGQLVVGYELEKILRDNLKEFKKTKQNNLCSRIVLRPSAFLEGNNLSVLKDVGIFIE